ncbi:MAG: putative ABC transporter ATP-binding protein [Chlamydiae bacterium]|nr:putative ABC transporter ATP-binding protein [Chlamydiota bacterium]
MKSRKKLKNDSVPTQLQRVISDQTSEFFGLKGQNPLAQTCFILCRAMGFALDKGSESEESLDAICSKSQIFYRTINLKDKWWEKDHGHFVGTYQGQPVALLYKNYHYYIVSPTTQEQIPLDAKNSQELAPQGFMLYPPASEKASIARILAQSILKRKKSDYIYLAIAGLLSAFLGFLFPFSNKILFDRIIPNFDYTLFTQIILALIIGITGGALFSFARSFFSLRLNGTIAHELQMNLWDRLIKLPTQFFRRYLTGDLIQRTQIFNQIRRELSQNTLITIFNGIFTLAYLVMMLLYNWQLTLVGLGVIFCTFFISLVVIYFKIHWDGAILASNAQINSFLVQMVNGIDKLRTAAAEKRVFLLWTKEYAENQTLNLKSKFLQAIITTLNASTQLILILVVFGVVIWMRSTSPTSISIGDYLAFSAAFFPFSKAVFSILSTFSSLISLFPFWKRIQPIFSSPLESTKEQRHPGILTGQFDMKALYFRYYKQAPFVIQDLTINVEANTFVGIAGPTGCGKSTLARLMIGFETAERGCVCYDEKDMRELDLPEVRKQINVILQQNAIFSGKLYDNIVCGGEYSDAEIEKAMHLSTFDIDLARFPAQLEMILPCGGGLLSGGERQRLLLTRALLRNPKILILDEALNSLDSPSQRKIVENLQKLPMTKVLITHQLNVLEKLDMIFLMKEGRLVASGTFEELLQREPFFQQLVASQSI